MDAFTRRKMIELIRRQAAARKPTKRPPRMSLPDGVALSYYAALLGALKPMRAVEADLLAELDKVAQRDDADKPGSGMLRDAIKRAEADFARRMRASMGNLERIARRAALATGEHNRRQLVAQAKAQIGVELPFADLSPGKVKGFVRDNVALIETVPERYFGELRALVEDYASSGKRPETLADEIRGRWGVAQTNAARIARHQVAKLNGEVHVERLRDAGVTRCIWRSMRDGRVRDSHEKLEGVAFDLDDPPAEGIPGEEIGCRCYYEPDFRSVGRAAA